MAKGCVSAAEAKEIESSGTKRKMSEAHKKAIANSKKGKSLSAAHKQATSEGRKRGASQRKSSGEAGRCPKGTYSKSSLQRKKKT